MNRRAVTVGVVRQNRIFGIIKYRNGFVNGHQSAYYMRKLVEGGTFTGYYKDLRKN